MVETNQAAPSPVEGVTEEGKPASVHELLRQFDPDRQALQGQLSPMFQAVWHNALTCLEEALPDHKRPGTADYKLFTAMRHRILDVGNRQLRELPKVLGCFAVQQLIRRQTVEQVTMPAHGPFHLPAGVKIRGQEE